MKQTFPLLMVLLLHTVTGVANIHHLNINRISSDSSHVNAFTDIKQHTDYYDHWSAHWQFDQPKQSVINRLHTYYTLFAALPKQNTETELLLGDIAHYLYNMDDSASYRIAINHYNNAIESSPADYRGHWFLGYHYALSNAPTAAIEHMLIAEKLLPTQPPAEFWNEYAWATAVANMPSHCIYAMDQVKRITRQEGSFQQQLGETIYKRITPVNKNRTYEKQTLWTALDGVQTTFVSRPLGMSITLDSNWMVQVYDYEKRQAAFVMTPPELLGKKGVSIGYTIAMIIKTADDTDKLSDYLQQFVAKYPNKKTIAFSKAYDNLIAYEIKDRSVYREIGGGHLYMIGIERTKPPYPGLLLEYPVSPPQGTPNEVAYYRAADSKDRFDGKLFYLLMLDTCEDIHDASFAIFKNLFSHQLVIE